MNGMKINIRVRASKTCEQFRQQIRGRNRGGCKVDHVLLRPCEVVEKVVADLKHPDCTVVELVASGGDGGLFCRADDEFGVKLFFEGADVCADGWLCQIKSSGSFGETAVIDDGDKGF